MEKQEIEQKIKELEEEMTSPDFWSDKEKAQEIIKEIQNLKDELEGVGQYDRGDAVMTIFSGAGGDDSEDFSAMLLKMYFKYFENKGWSYYVLHENQKENRLLTNQFSFINFINSFVFINHNFLRIHNNYFFLKHWTI